MNFTSFKLVSASLLLAALSACGGGGGGTTSNTTPPAIETIKFNKGGNPANPAAISFEQPNEINSDSFQNNFKVNVKAGDTLIIKSTIMIPLENNWMRVCSFNQSMDQGIVLVDLKQSCNERIRYTFEKPGEHIVKILYPNNTPGSFDAALTSNATLAEPTLSASGKPNQPRLISLTGENLIVPNDFLNHYAIDLKVGNIISIQSYVDKAATTDETRVCNFDSGSYDFGFGIEINKTRFSCGNTLEHLATYDGRYFFNFRYPSITQGYFKAVVK
jgi:hypothetical protein